MGGENSVEGKHSDWQLRSGRQDTIARYLRRESNIIGRSGGVALTHSEKA